jgi:hypothetical protein
MKEESITMSFYTFLGVCDTTGMVVLLGNGGGGGGNGGGTGGTSIPIQYTVITLTISFIALIQWY